MQPESNIAVHDVAPTNPFTASLYDVTLIILSYIWTFTFLCVFIRMWTSCSPMINWTTCHACWNWYHYYIFLRYIAVFISWLFLQLTIVWWILWTIAFRFMSPTSSSKVWISCSSIFMVPIMPLFFYITFVASYVLLFLHSDIKFVWQNNFPNTVSIRLKVLLFLATRFLLILSILSLFYFRKNYTIVIIISNNNINNYNNRDNNPIGELRWSLWYHKLKLATILNGPLETYRK